MKEIQMMLERRKLSGLRSFNLGSCKDFILEEQHNVSFGINEESLRLSRLELSPAHVPSLGEVLYFTIFVDDMTRKV